MSDHTGAYSMSAEDTDPARLSEQNVQVTQALEPCLCGRPVNLFRFYERADEEGAHINLDCSGLALDECPLNLSLTRDVRSEADVNAFLSAWNHRTRAEPDLVEAVAEMLAARDDLEGADTARTITPQLERHERAINRLRAALTRADV